MLVISLIHLLLVAAWAAVPVYDVAPCSVNLMSEDEAQQRSYADPSLPQIVVPSTKPLSAETMADIQAALDRLATQSMVTFEDRITYFYISGRRQLQRPRNPLPQRTMDEIYRLADAEIAALGGQLPARVRAKYSLSVTFFLVLETAQAVPDPEKIHFDSNVYTKVRNIMGQGTWFAADSNDPRTIANLRLAHESVKWLEAPTGTVSFFSGVRRRLIDGASTIAIPHCAPLIRGPRACLITSITLDPI